MVLKEIGILLIFLLLGCLEMLSPFTGLMGVSEEDLTEIGLGHIFGVEKIPKVRTMRIEAPEFVGMDILLVKAPKEVTPGAYEDIDIFLGNNYYGSTAGNITLQVLYPFGFKIESLDSVVSEDTEIDGETKNVAIVRYDKMEYGDGDVVTMTVKIPEKEYTANIRYYYPARVSLNYWYSVMLKEDLPAVSSSYYKALAGRINKSVSIQRTYGEISITPRMKEDVIRIPDMFFSGDKVYNKTLTFEIKDLGGGAVMGDYVIYFLGFKKKGFLEISLREYGGWEKVDDPTKEAERLRELGLEYSAEIIEEIGKIGGEVYKIRIPSSSNMFSATLKIKLFPGLQNTVFEIPVIFMAIYNYEISKDIYIKVEKVIS